LSSSNLVCLNPRALITYQRLTISTRGKNRCTKNDYSVKDIKKRKKEDLGEYALGDHRVGYLEETRDVGAHDVVTGLAEELGGVIGILVDVDHDAV